MNEQTSGTSAELPRYLCHKEVHALKIGHAVMDEDSRITLFFVLKHFASITLSRDESHRFKRALHDDPGWYMLYKDAYVSWSPSKAFESGYAEISPDPQEMAPETAFKFGDYVACEIAGTKNFGFIIGQTDYSDGDVFVIADNKYVGMPTHRQHLSIAGSNDAEHAHELRAHFQIEFPGRLKELDDA